MIYDRLQILLAPPIRVRQATINALTIVVTGAVILPLFTPVIGHHPIEALPDHGHIYTRGVPIEHVHSRESGRHRDNSDATTDSKGIIYLPSNADTTGGNSFNVIPTALALSLIIIVPPSLVYLKSILDTFPTIFIPRVETPPPQSAL